MSSVSDKYSHYFRFCYGSFDEIKDITAVEKLGELASEMLTVS